MPVLNIKVREKIAQTSGSPEVVCGNSDYVAVFDLDEEWESYFAKTMRVAWLDIPTGKMRFADVPFTGSTAVLPVIYDAYQIAIGVYAGDIRTTTPARIPCARCITDGEPLHPDPPPDIYEQLLEAITHLAPKVEGAIAGNAVVKFIGCYGFVGLVITEEVEE